MAYDIQRFNPSLDVAVVSGEALSHHLRGGGLLPFRPDVVHLLTEYVGHGLQDHFIGRVPLVNSIHHVEDWGFVEPLMVADGIMVVCDQWRDQLIERGVPASQLGMLHNGVDTEMFTPGGMTERAAARAAVGLPTDAFVVGMASKRSSNTSGRKAPEVFEAAVSQLAVQLPGFAVFILGPGWGDLVASLRRQGVTCVHRDYIVQHGDLRDFYRCLDAYWVTSRIEGGPVPLLEAMSCGVPGVSTPVGIAPEVIHPGVNGALVEFDNVAGFVIETQRMAESSTFRQVCGEAARAEIVRWMRREQTAPAATAVYQHAIQQFAARNGSTRPLPDQPDHPAVMRTLLAMDNAFWARDLVAMGVGRRSIGYATAAISGGPISPIVWRSLVRTYTPSRIRAVAKAFRHSIEGHRMRFSAQKDIVGEDS